MLFRDMADGVISHKLTKQWISNIWSLYGMYSRHYLIGILFAGKKKWFHTRATCTLPYQISNSN